MNSNESNSRSQILTVAERFWLNRLLDLADAYPNSSYADKSTEDYRAMARVWARDLRVIPTDKIKLVCAFAMDNIDNSFPPTQGTFREAWYRYQESQLSPTYQELEQNRHGREDKEAEKSGQTFSSEIPISSQIFRKLGRAIVCRCKYSDGIQMSAKIEDLGRGPRWVCGRGHCTFNIDANDEKAVSKVSIEPLVMRTGAEISEPMNSRLIVSVSQSRAEIFADQINVEWADRSESERQQIRQMATWADLTKTKVNADNFVLKWAEFQSYLADRGIEAA